MLNEAQLRHVSVALRLAEERLLDLQRRLNDKPAGQLLYVEDDLSDVERARIAEKISDLLRQIVVARQHLALTPGWQSLRRTIAGALSVTWADLQDVKAGPLSAYGETDPQLKDILDPIIDRIADGLSEICKALAGDDDHERKEA